MKIGDVRLQTNYATGQGYIYTSDTTAAVATLGGSPSLVTMYKNYGTPTQSQTTYKVSQVGPGVAVLGSVVSGSDQAFSVGDFVMFQTSSLSTLDLDSIFGTTAGKTLVRGTSTWAQDIAPRLAKVAIAGTSSTSGGGIAAWVPTEGAPAIIQRTILRTTVKSTGAANVSIGVGTNATTSSANLIDTLDVGTAVVCADNITDKGTLGKSRQLLSGAQYLTVTGSADTSGLVGSLYVEYLLP